MKVCHNAIVKIATSLSLSSLEGNKYANKLCSLTYRTSIDLGDLCLIWLRASDKNAVFADDREKVSIPGDATWLIARMI